MKRKIEITVIERERIFGGGGQTFCPLCQKFAEFLTTGQAARFAKVKPATIRRWLLTGKTHGIKTAGRQHRVCRRSLFPAVDNKRMFVVGKN